MRATLLALAGFTVAGCGAGTAGILAASDGDGGGAAPALNDLRLAGTPQSPALLSFSLTGAAHVEFAFALPGVPDERAMQHLAGVPGGRATLAAGQHAFAWEFAAEQGAPAQGERLDGVRVHVRVAGQTFSVLAGLGNTLPSLGAIDAPAGEASGIVLLRTTLIDTPFDLAKIRVEFERGDGAGWRPARPAQATSTPEFAFDNAVAEAGGTPLAFFWDTRADLGTTEADVLVRFVPFEDVEGTLLAGIERVTQGTLRIDNNAAPLAVLNNEQLLLNSDARAALPVPFLLSDAESDEVDVVLQWRRPEEPSWPELPPDAESLRALLESPERADERRALRICSPAALVFEGTLAPLPAGLAQPWSDPLTTLRLPELATTAAPLRERGVGPRTIELVRTSAVQLHDPGPALASPVALAAEAGSVLVLEAPPAGWTLRRTKLDDPAFLVTLLDGPGRGTALARTPDGRTILVAALDSGSWRLTAFDPASGARVEHAGAAADADGIRALLPLDRARVLFTAGDGLWLFDLERPSGARAVLDGLSTPWGLARDPCTSERVYLAEHARDRLLAVDLRSLVTSPVPAPGLIGPRGLVSLGADRLLVLGEPAPGVGRLVALRPRASGTLDAEPSADPAVAEIPLPFDDPLAGIGVGAEGELLVASSSRGRLAVGGGLLAARALAPSSSRDASFAFDPAHQLVRLAAPLDAVPPAGTRWRIHDRQARFRGDPLALAPRTFLWDTRDVLGGGEVILRIVPLDSDVGLSSAGLGARSVRAALDIAPHGVPSAPGLERLALGDVDGDGDLDLVGAGRQDVGFRLHYNDGGAPLFERSLLVTHVELQDEPSGVCIADVDADGRGDVIGSFARGQFVPGQIAVLYQSSTGAFDRLFNDDRFPSAEDIQAADLDGDERIDLVTAIPVDDQLVLSFQESGANPFPVRSLVKGIIAAQALTASDLDLDGDLDLVVSNATSDTLTTVIQTGFRSFALDQIVLGPVLPWDVAVGDLDADGRPEVVSANRFGGDVSILAQDALGRFAVRETLIGDPAAPGANAVWIADLDGNGELDLAATSHSSPSLGLFLQSEGVFARRVALRADVAGVSWRGLVAGDLEGDGDIELVAADGLGSRVFTFAPRRAGGREPSLTRGRSLPGPNDTRRRTLVADLDDDGDLDVASSEGVNGTLRAWFQLAPELFTSGASVASLQDPGALTACDADGDGDLDLAVVESGRDQVRLLAQSGPGVFAALGPPLAAGASAAGLAEIAAADLDLDGRVELCTVNAGAGTLTVFDNQSAGFGGPRVVLDSLAAFPSLLVRDLDRDGAPDLVAASFAGGVVHLLRGRGDGSFQPETPWAAAATPSPLKLACADLDRDGALDLLVNCGATELRTFRQRTDRSFEPDPLQVRSLGIAATLDAGDLDGDGWPDVLGVDPVQNTLVLSMGHGSGRLEPVLALPLAFPISVLGGVLVDLGGDGDLDVVTTHTSSGQGLGPIRIFYGGH